jgi:CubicO group peptidase (beta-lactamase class C family)
MAQSFSEFGHASNAIATRRVCLVDCGSYAEAVEQLDDLASGWPSPAHAAIGVTTATAVVGLGGDVGRVSRVASISKMVVSMAALVAVEEGTIDLNDAAGPPGATVRHLLAHASGLDFRDHRVIAEVGKKRIYSNAGINAMAEHVAAASAMPFEEYQRLAVLEPLGMRASSLQGPPADSLHSSVADLLTFAQELMGPRLVHPSTLAEALTPQFPDLAGVLPDYGRFDPNPWGLGFELRSGKSPHWTGSANSPGTFGHFGGTGTFLWVDPAAGIACVAISGTEFGEWAKTAWPIASDAVLSRFALG